MITTSDVLEKLKEAVDEYGLEYRDINACNAKSCLNVYMGRRCIAAEVLSRLGVSDTDLIAYNDYHIRDTVDKLQIDITDEALDMLGDAQFEQDCGKAWGQVLSTVMEHQANGYYK